MHHGPGNGQGTLEKLPPSELPRPPDTLPVEKERVVLLHNVKIPQAVLQVRRHSATHQRHRKPI